MLKVHKSSGFGDLGMPVWDVTLCLMLAYTIIYFAIFKSVKTSGKVIRYVQISKISVNCIKISSLLTFNIILVSIKELVFGLFRDLYLYPPTGCPVCTHQQTDRHVDNSPKNLIYLSSQINLKIDDCVCAPTNESVVSPLCAE